MTTSIQTALEAIEILAGDDLTDDPLEAVKRIGDIYCIAHSERKNCGCHPIHDDWRKIKSEVLKKKER